MERKVLVVDLDETLYSINTFHYFIKFILFQALKQFNIALFGFISYVCFLRVFKKLSHSKLKFLILKRIENENINYFKFVQQIQNKRRDLPIDVNNYHLKILATGAPYNYARLIAENEGFDVCIGTTYPTKLEQPVENYENIKEVKRANVLCYLKKVDLENCIDTFITDHLDDLPLIEIATKNIIINADKKMKAKLNSEGINNCTFVYC